MVLNIDDPTLRKFADEFEQEITTYGSAAAADLRYLNYQPLPGAGGQADLFFEGEARGKLKIQVPGEYNLQNALAALGAALSLEIPMADAVAALGEFSGVRRRFELKGRVNGVTIIDDYAHHPRELTATLRALREQFHGTRIGIFQPHRVSRTEALLEEFSTVFSDLDRLYVLDIYAAGETDRPGVNSEKLAALISAAGHEAVNFATETEGLVNELVAQVKEGDVVITLGAGNVWQVGETLRDRLKAQ